MWDKCHVFQKQAPCGRSSPSGDGFGKLLESEFLIQRYWTWHSEKGLIWQRHVYLAVGSPCPSSWTLPEAPGGGSSCKAPVRQFIEELPLSSITHITCRSPLKGFGGIYVCWGNICVLGIYVCWGDICVLILTPWHRMPSTVAIGNSKLEIYPPNSTRHPPFKVRSLMLTASLT